MLATAPFGLAVDEAAGRATVADEPVDLALADLKASAPHPRGISSGDSGGYRKDLRRQEPRRMMNYRQRYRP